MYSKRRPLFQPAFSLPSLVNVWISLGLDCLWICTKSLEKSSIISCEDKQKQTKKKLMNTLDECRCCCRRNVEG